MIHLLTTILLWVQKYYFPSGNSHIRHKSIDYWLLTTKKLIDTVGSVEAIKILKSIRNHVTRYLCGQPLLFSGHPRLALNAKGIPTMLGPLQSLLYSGNKWELRFLMTQLLISRLIPGHKAPDFGSITNPPKVDMDLVHNIHMFSKSLCLPPIDTSWVSFHISSKSGPNGQAMDTALYDLSLLPDWLYESIAILGGENLRAEMEKRKALSLIFGPVLGLVKLGRKTLRRQSVVKDPEAKSRVIAIFDYWSQSSQFELHNRLMTLISSFTGDCTISQDSRQHKVKALPHYHSLDQTTATDRFPISLQVKILGDLIGTDKANAWADILVKIPFDSDIGPLHYAAGQPMGAYSSWASFALCHHIVVLYSAIMVGKPNYSNYMQLGDDLVLGDDDVALSYTATMTGLGVSVSPLKTHVSKDTFEFAKRWIHKGNEITGAPIKGLLELKGNLMGFLSFHSTMQRNWQLDWSGSRSMIVDLFRIVFKDVKALKLYTTRVYECMILPLNSDSQAIRDYKAWLCFKHLLFSYMGCNTSLEQVWLTLDQLIPTVKMGTYETTIKKTFKSLTVYKETCTAKVNEYPDLIGVCGIDTGQIVNLQIPLCAGQSYSVKQQMELDRMNDLFEKGIEEEILKYPPIIGFDPTKLVHNRREVVLYGVMSKIPKDLKTLVRMYTSKRTLASCDGS